MVVITLGSFTFNRLRDFDEVKTRRIARELNVGSAGNADESVSVTKPRQITLVARLTGAERTTMENLQETYDWHALSDDAVLIDYVWIEDTEMRFRQTEMVDAPWLATINLTCSNV